MSHTIISEAARQILAASTIEHNILYLPPGQLPRPLYEEVNDVLTRLGGTWRGGKVKGHVFDNDPALERDIVVKTGLLPPRNPTAYFPTPDLITHRMLYDAAFGVCLLDLVAHSSPRLLEPSAGRGAIANSLRAYAHYHQLDAVLHCCEIVPAFAAYLRCEGFEVVAEDFLAYRPSEGYHAILMNPPFSVEGDALAYITHIEHAWTLLVPGGLLTAIAPTGFTFRQDQRSRRFRLLVEEYGLWEPLPHDTFAASGTHVETVLLSMRKPHEAQTCGSLVPLLLPQRPAPMQTASVTRSLQEPQVAQEMLLLAK